MTFLKHFFITLLGLGFLCATINFLIDPLGIYGSPAIKHFNTAKSPGAPRFFKPLQTSAQQPQIVFLGSSRVQVGFDPKETPGSYNHGIPGIQAAELKGYGLHILEDTNVKHLIIGLDFGSFNDSKIVNGSYTSAELGKHALLKALPKTLFSLDALSLSRKTIKRSFKGEPSNHKLNGLYVMKIPETITPKALLIKSVKEFLSPGGSYTGYTTFKRSLGDLNYLLSIAIAKGVKVTLFISPTHATLTEALDIAKLWNLYEEWKRHLTLIASKHKISLWDFGGYSDLSTMQISNAQSSFIDASHYRPSVGKYILKIMMQTCKNSVFNFCLTPENISAKLLTQRIRRTQYRIENNTDRKEIQNIACSLPLYSSSQACNH